MPVTPGPKSAPPGRLGTRCPVRYGDAPAVGGGKASGFPVPLVAGRVVQIKSGIAVVQVARCTVRSGRLTAAELVELKVMGWKKDDR